ncbi:MAG: PKD domain-containing protein [Candidatus Bathyarchaeales archaeon]
MHGLFDYHWRAKALIKECNAAIARGEDIPLPSATITPLTSSITLGQSVSLTGSVSGGASPYTYQWYVNGTAISGATSSSWTFTPTSGGTYEIYLNVTDADGYTAKSGTAIVNVLQAQGPTLGDAWIIILVLVVIVGAVAAVAILLVTKKKMPSASNV